jgi:2-oxoisovalerate dehydrogenase E1 component
LNWLKVAREMLLSRELDLLEEQQLTPQGKVKYQFSAKGHELSQVLLAQTLDHPHDAAAVYYRSRPFMLASGLSPVEALSAGMALTGSPSDGRDVGVVFNRPGLNDLTVLPSSGDVGAQYSPAAGWAQAVCHHYRTLKENDWEGSIAVALGGDGSVAANGFWAALNIATTIQLPLLFFIEDNNFGISVPASYQTPGGNISVNLSCFGNLKVLDGDGTNPQEAWDLISAGIEHVRSWDGPCLLHLEVPRLGGHTFIDDQSYKSPELRAAEHERDPIPRLRSFLLEKKLINEGGWDQMLEEVRAALADAVEQVEALAQPDVTQATRYLFFEGEPPQQGGLRPENHETTAGMTAGKTAGSQAPESSGPRINFIDAVRRTL